ncbi:DUF1232 domain-containing protein [Xenophilus arseniciresistens]|uniref:DUF1232 domain-containing protein n=1 Tax=Xenophilus arseniciresistens TaxID=1283306 RepID=A0AAE3N3M9_9BURK|nr:DUF1232 domain-containing protein [Xenophilus arseniciresistens]MDA7415185.1 DUF1232 domain-containing protein [Xenophilus arseniciresistens]
MWKLGRVWFALRKELALAWALLRDSRSPWSARLAVLAAAVYLLSPVDFVSDLLPVLGWIDDGVVAVLLLKLATRLLPPELATALRAKVGQRQPAAR